ncbi:MAG: hypothetical protein QM811_24820 [Pirellulales bacterium]
MIRSPLVSWRRWASLALIGSTLAGSVAQPFVHAQCPHGCGCESTIANPDVWNAKPAPLPFSWDAPIALPVAEPCLVDCPEAFSAVGGCFSIHRADTRTMTADDVIILSKHITPLRAEVELQVPFSCGPFVEGPAKTKLAEAMVALFRAGMPAPALPATESAAPALPAVDARTAFAQFAPRNLAETNQELTRAADLRVVTICHCEDCVDARKSPAVATVTDQAKVHDVATMPALPSAAPQPVRDWLDLATEPHPLPHGVCPLPIGKVGETTAPEIAAVMQAASYEESFDHRSAADSHVVLASDEHDDCPGARSTAPTTSPTWLSSSNVAPLPSAGIPQYGAYGDTQLIHNPYVTQTSPPTYGSCATGGACTHYGPCDDQAECATLDAIVRRLERNAPGCINSPAATPSATTCETAKCPPTEQDKAPPANWGYAIADGVNAEVTGTVSCENACPACVAAAACPCRPQTNVAVPLPFQAQSHAWVQQYAVPMTGTPSPYAQPNVAPAQPTQAWSTAPHYAPQACTLPAFASTPAPSQYGPPICSACPRCRQCRSMSGRSKGISFSHSSAPATQRTKATTEAQQALKQTIRELEASAERLEDLKLFEQADTLRATAAELRAESRAMTVELDAKPAEPAAQTAGRMFDPYVSRTVPNDVQLFPRTARKPLPTPDKPEGLLPPELQYEDEDQDGPPSSIPPGFIGQGR